MSASSISVTLTVRTPKIFSTVHEENRIQYPERDGIHELRRGMNREAILRACWDIEWLFRRIFGGEGRSTYGFSNEPNKPGITGEYTSILPAIERAVHRV